MTITTPQQAWDFGMLALCVWREAQGEDRSAWRAVAWTLHNRAVKPGKTWWGDSYSECVLKPWQFSSFNKNDPNATKMPFSNDPVFADIMLVCAEVFNGTDAVDLTQGATYYFDKSLDKTPPVWATNGKLVKTVDIGRLHFYREL